MIAWAAVAYMAAASLWAAWRGQVLGSLAFALASFWFWCCGVAN